MRNLSFSFQFRRNASLLQSLYVKTAGENFFKGKYLTTFPLDSEGSEKSTPLCQ